MRAFFAGILLLACSRAMALQPESGWWWNSAESGRGFVIEVQNNVMFFAGYLYAPNGAATWYVSQGFYDHGAARYTGALLEFGGGQCMGCPYRAPGQLPSPGQVTVTFSNQTTGVVTWPGGAVPIARTEYGHADQLHRLLGAWAYTVKIGTAGADAEWLTMTGVETINGARYAVGTNIRGRLVVATIDSAGSYLVLSDSSDSFWELYKFPVSAAGVNSMVNGRNWFYSKDGEPFGDGYPSLAHKFGPMGARAKDGASPDPRGAVSELLRVSSILLSTPRAQAQ